eukprot:TRINITY_DN33175_c0_g1_i2.p1 TRINITY_DN33175_c0_g1~~TRINITY_DN33175_c0_g1_i2.p1  ORF type:complete len:613 (+),score=63.18 TRINITY_DN33175_c0_g1_i2:39-1841(+)
MQAVKAWAESATPIVLGKSASSDPSSPASLPPGWVHDDAPGWGKDGVQLHGMRVEDQGGVPITSWCVTFRDLVFLRDCLQKAVADGEIQPSERDQFVTNDNEVGPNMYTVCGQYIKPLTQKAGNMSWALMRHPEGIPCDLFITHAWIEGMYEFIDKALNSWPSGKKACYICLLSNPQNLDISSLISSPRNSPFALCLGTSTHMLVIPNRCVSIYSRLWCVYEAFLAYQHEKVIFTAAPPKSKTLIKHLAVLAVPCATGCIIGGGVIDGCALADELQELLPACLVIAVLTKLFNSLDWPGLAIHTMCNIWLRFPLLFFSTIAGAGLAGVVSAASLREYAMGCLEQYDMPAESHWKIHGTLVLSLTLTFYFFACEVDRVLECRASEEALQLSRQFTSVEAAGCSNQDDAVRIKSEIDQEMLNVDHAVQVLRAAGMSTPSLRGASALGVDISGAGRISISNMSFVIGFWLSMQIMYIALPGLSAVFLASWVSCAALLFTACTAWYWKAMPDRRAFAISVSAKVNLVTALWLRYTTEEDSSVNEMAIWFGTLIATSSVFSVSLSYIGMQGIARIPCAGPYLAAMLGPRCLICNRRRKRIESFCE